MKRLLAGIAAVLLAGAASGRPIAFIHVRLIDGTGAAAIEDATLVIDGDRIVAAGRDAAVPAAAERRDYSGRTILPGLISDHSHVGSVLGATTGPQNYTRDNIVAQLAQYRRYGVTTVTALGNNRPLFDALRRDAHAGRLPADLFGVDQGIGVPMGAPPQATLKAAPDQMFRPATPAEATAAVDRMAAEGTDLVKIWVDNFNGTLPVKMDPAVIRAVVAETHAKGLRVAAHIHDLGDAERVVALGVDILAHGVRDRDVPATFAAELKRRGIWYIATLELDEATTAWADRQPWTRTPFARAALSPALAAEVDDPAWARATATGPQADFARRSLAMNLRNLAALDRAGVRIGFGTDSGAAAVRVPGIAEHRELALSVQAGLSPLRALTLATGRAAALLDLSDRGVLRPGKRADLLVVEGDPSRDIAAADRVVETWANGTAVPGPVPLGWAGRVASPLVKRPVMAQGGDHGGTGRAQTGARADDQ